MTSNNDENRSNSPMHLSLSGQFSPEDIQELLGVMGDGCDQNHHLERGDEEESQSGVSLVVAYAPAGGTMYGEANASPKSSSVSNQPTGAVQSNGASISVGSCATSCQDGVGEELKAQARSERKRSREKQRRSDVNKQFADLTQLLQKIDSEDVNQEDVLNGTTSNRVTFNPSNRVDLIARTIVLLERLHEANKRRKSEISCLQQELEEAKKAGEETAAKLKDAMLGPPGRPLNKQFMMMVPMMMSSDGSGASSGVPVINPFMPHAFCPVPTQAMAAAVAAAPISATAAQAGQVPAPAVASAVPNSQVLTAAVVAPPLGASTQQLALGHSTAQQHQPAPAAFPYMMASQLAGAGGFMMPLHASGHAMLGQQMTMVQPPIPSMGVQQRVPQQDSNGQQEQKESPPGLNGGSNLAHCA